MELGTAAFWTKNLPDLLLSLETTASGLTQAEADRRIRKVGANVITEQEGVSVVRLLLRQYESPLVLILIFGTFISLLVGDWMDAIIIMLIVLGSTILGFTQEYRASSAVQRLHDRLALRSTVLRDGQPQLIDAKRIVPGDIIMLSAGNLVPADAIVVEARDFLVTQAALTGESFPVEKVPGTKPADASLPERTNAVFLGTSVRSGTAKILVVRTGLTTEFAAITERIMVAKTETDFERGIRNFGYLLTRIMTAIVIAVLTVNLLLHRPLIESLLFAVALAVGLTPELLPAIISVSLSVGARQMAKRGVLVRRLDAIENLGGIDILCTDKTGTLTKGTVELSAAVDPNGKPSDHVFHCAAINSRLESGIDNPLDAAIVAEADRRSVMIAPGRKVDEIPYDFIRKSLTIVTSDDMTNASHLIITKGAFDTVITYCDQIVTANGVMPLDDTLTEKIRSYYQFKSNEGFRVLGLATKRVAIKPRYDHTDEAGMVFEGFLLFFDPVKDGVKITLGELSALGITTKIISGDNRHVAAHVGNAIGLNTSRLLTGQDLNLTKDEALWHLAEVTEIFAEVDPQQKERIVHALQRRGHSVAYLGDGINDGPALQAADVGVSVDQAVDVARESADVVLLQQDLGVLRDGIISGRRTFVNMLKYIGITTSANFGNMISMALATLFVPFLPMLAKQILLNNFLSDFPSVAIATDNVDPEFIDRPQRWNLGKLQSFMIIFGLVSTLFDLLTFSVLLLLFKTSEPLFQSTWFMVSLLTELAVVLVLRTRQPCWRSKPGRLLSISTGVVVGIAICLTYVGIIARPFNFVPLPVDLLLTGVIIVVLYIGATEAAKQRYYAKLTPRGQWLP